MKSFFLILFILSYFYSLQELATDDFYVKNSEMQANLARDFILEDLKIHSSDRVLDIGCGDGRHTREIAMKLTTGDVTAIDSSSQMIDYAKVNSHHPLVKYINLDVKQLDELDGKFDVIVSFSAFHWFDKPKEALAKMAKKLKQGGRLYILSYPKESQDWSYYKEAFLVKDDLAQYFDAQRYESMFSRADFEREARFLNCKILKIEIKDHLQFYSETASFKNNIKGWLEWFCPSLPKEKYEDYVDRVVDKGKSQFQYNSQGNMRVPYKSITVILEKLNV